MAKNFSKAPKPKILTEEQIIAFEQGGAGHDKAKQQRLSDQSIVTRKGSGEPTKRLSLDLPLSLHTRFKTACSATNRKMVNELQIFIEQHTHILEKEAGSVFKSKK